MPGAPTPHTQSQSEPARPRTRRQHHLASLHNKAPSEGEANTPPTQDSLSAAPTRQGRSSSLTPVSSLDPASQAAQTPTRVPGTQSSAFVCNLGTPLNDQEIFLNPHLDAHPSQQALPHSGTAKAFHATLPADGANPSIPVETPSRPSRPSKAVRLAGIQAAKAAAIPARLDQGALDKDQIKWIIDHKAFDIPFHPPRGPLRRPKKNKQVPAGKDPLVRAVTCASSGTTFGTLFAAFPFDPLQLPHLPDFIQAANVSTPLPTSAELYNRLQNLSLMYPIMKLYAEERVTAAPPQDTVSIGTLALHNPRYFSFPFLGHAKDDAIKNGEAIYRHTGRTAPREVRGMDNPRLFSESLLYACNDTSYTFGIVATTLQPPAAVLNVLSSSLAPLWHAVKNHAIEALIAEHGNGPKSWPTHMSAESRRIAKTANNPQAGKLSPETWLDIYIKALGRPFGVDGVKSESISGDIRNADQCRAYRDRLSTVLNHSAHCLSILRSSILNTLCGADKKATDDLKPLADDLAKKERRLSVKELDKALPSFLVVNGRYQMYDAPTPEWFDSFRGSMWDAAIEYDRNPPCKHATLHLIQELIQVVNKNQSATEIKRWHSIHSQVKSYQGRVARQRINAGILSSLQELLTSDQPEDVSGTMQGVDKDPAITGLRYLPPEWDTWDLVEFLGIARMQDITRQTEAVKYGRPYPAHASTPHPTTGRPIWTNPVPHSLRSQCSFPAINVGDPSQKARNLDDDTISGVFQPRYHQLHAVALFFAKASSADSSISNVSSMILADEPGMGKTAVIALCLALFRWYANRLGKEDDYLPAVLLPQKPWLHSQDPLPDRNQDPDPEPSSQQEAVHQSSRSSVPPNDPTPSTGRRVHPLWLGQPYPCDMTVPPAPSIIVTKKSLTTPHTHSMTSLLSTKRFTIAALPHGPTDKSKREEWIRDLSDPDTPSKKRQFRTLLIIVSWPELEREYRHHMSTVGKPDLDGSLYRLFPEFQFVFFDEAHEARSPWSQSFQAAHALSRIAVSRWAVTATPVYNSPLDLLNILRLLGTNLTVSPAAPPGTGSAPPLNPPPPTSTKRLTNLEWYRDCHPYYHTIIEAYAAQEKQRQSIQKSIATLRKGEKEQGAFRVGPGDALSAFNVLDLPEGKEAPPAYADLRQAWSAMQTAVSREVLAPLLAICKPVLIRRNRDTMVPHLQASIIPPVNIDAIKEEVQLTPREMQQYKAGLLADQDAILPIGFSIELRMNLIDPHFAQHKFADRSAPPSSKVQAVAAKCRAIISDDRALTVKEQRKILIYLHWTVMAEFLAAVLRNLGVATSVVTGSTPQAERFKHCADFQRDEDHLSCAVVGWDNTGKPVQHPAVGCRVMIITDALSTGTNLQRGSVLLMFDASWSYAEHLQLVGRIARIGQTFPVSIIQFICKDTIDEWLLKVQSRRRGWTQLDQQQINTIENAIANVEMQVRNDPHDPARPDDLVLDQAEEAVDGDESGYDTDNEEFQHQQGSNSIIRDDGTLDLATSDAQMQRLSLEPAPSGTLGIKGTGEGAKRAHALVVLSEEPYPEPPRPSINRYYDRFVYKSACHQWYLEAIAGSYLPPNLVKLRSHPIFRNPDCTVSFDLCDAYLDCDNAELDPAYLFIMPALDTLVLDHPCDPASDETEMVDLLHPNRDLRPVFQTSRMNRLRLYFYRKFVLKHVSAGEALGLGIVVECLLKEFDFYPETDRQCFAVALVLARLLDDTGSFHAHGLSGVPELVSDTCELAKDIIPPKPIPRTLKLIASMDLLLAGSEPLLPPYNLTACHERSLAHCLSDGQHLKLPAIRYTEQLRTWADQYKTYEASSNTDQSIDPHTPDPLEATVPSPQCTNAMTGHTASSPTTAVDPAQSQSTERADLVLRPCPPAKQGFRQQTPSSPTSERVSKRARQRYSELDDMEVDKHTGSLPDSSQFKAGVHTTVNSPASTSEVALQSKSRTSTVQPSFHVYANKVQHSQPLNDEESDDTEVDSTHSESMDIDRGTEESDDEGEVNINRPLARRNAILQTSSPVDESDEDERGVKGQLIDNSDSLTTPVAGGASDSAASDHAFDHAFAEAAAAYDADPAVSHDAVLPGAASNLEDEWSDLATGSSSLPQ